jgi:hypothetical protein
LDYRLRDSSHLKTETVKVLKRLLRLLEEVDMVVNEDGETGEVEFDLEDGEDAGEPYRTELQQLYQTIVDAVNLLFQLSMAIRKPADHDRLLNIKLKDEAFFEPWARQHITHKYPEAASFLADRLAAAMAKRKAVLKYRERHRAKLGKGLGVSGDSGSLDLSATEATEIAAGNNQLAFAEAQSVSGASQTSYATSLIKPQSASMVPDPPVESTEKQPFECPYCYHVIIIKHSKDWTNHIFRDLMPYTCVWEDCPIPSKLFDTRRMWAQHMDHTHPQMEQTKDSFVCPLCQGSVQTAASFAKHVGRHLEDLALFVLPRNHQIEDTSLEIPQEKALVNLVEWKSDPSIWPGCFEGHYPVDGGMCNCGAALSDERGSLRSHLRKLLLESQGFPTVEISDSQSTEPLRLFEEGAQILRSLTNGGEQPKISNTLDKGRTTKATRNNLERTSNLSRTIGRNHNTTSMGSDMQGKPPSQDHVQLVHESYAVWKCTIDSINDDISASEALPELTAHVGSDEGLSSGQHTSSR